MVLLLLRYRLWCCCSRRPSTTSTPPPTTTTLHDIQKGIHGDIDDDASDGWSFAGDAPGASTLEPGPEPVPVPVPALVPVPVLVPAPAPPVHALAQPEPSDLVWIPNKGSRFHAISCCGRMVPARARKVARNTAESAGFLPCKNCH